MEKVRSIAMFFNVSQVGRALIAARLARGKVAATLQSRNAFVTNDRDEAPAGPAARLELKTPCRWTSPASLLIKRASGVGRNLPR